MWSSHRALLMLAAVAAVIGPESTAAQTPTSPSEPVVVVQGNSLVKAMPDQAWVTFAVESRSKNPKEAQSQNAKVMSAVQEQLRAAGISKDAMRTLSIDLHLESDWVNGRQVPRGYVARNTLEIRLDDIVRVGEVIDIAITSAVRVDARPSLSIIG